MVLCYIGDHGNTSKDIHVRAGGDGQMFMCHHTLKGRMSQCCAIQMWQWSHFMSFPILRFNFLKESFTFFGGGGGETIKMEWWGLWPLNWVAEYVICLQFLGGGGGRQPAQVSMGVSYDTHNLFFPFTTKATYSYYRKLKKKNRQTTKQNSTSPII